MDKDGIKLLDSLSIEDANKLLSDAVSKCAVADSDVAAGVSPKEDVVDVGGVLDELDNIQREWVHDDITYMAHIYTYKMKDAMQKSIPRLIEAGMYEDAALIAASVFEKVDIAGIDDEFTVGNENLINDCIGYWRDIASKCDQETKMNIMDILRRLLIKPRNYDCGEYSLREFIEEELNDTDCLRRRLEWENEDIAAGEAPKGKLSYKAQNLGRHVTRKISLMKELGYPQGETDAVIKKYWALPEVREQQLACLLSEGRKEEAVRVLADGKKLDSGCRWAEAKHSERIIGLYKQMGRAEDCKREMLYYVFGTESPRVDSREFWDILKQLKAACDPDEWAGYREKMLQSKRFASIHYKILDEDGLYERLLDMLLEKGSVREVDEFEKKLKPLFPDKLMFFYGDYVVKTVPTLRKMNEFTAIVPYLTKVASYPGGKSLADLIASQLKTDYACYRSFMEDLEKAGF